MPRPPSRTLARGYDSPSTLARGYDSFSTAEGLNVFGVCERASGAVAGLGFAVIPVGGDKSLLFGRAFQDAPKSAGRHEESMPHFAECSVALQSWHV